MTDVATRCAWVQSAMEMLELEPLQSKTCATMSFEQRKRVSIGLELAANPKRAGQQGESGVSIDALRFA